MKDSDSAQIAIVDDDYSVRESLRGFIRSLGFAVETFSSAEEFLRLECLRRTKLLILDVRMPGMSGLELQKKLAEICSDIPIIFITAHEDEAAHSQALRNGAIAYLQKPFSEESLLKAIYSALKITLSGLAV